ncbi:MAG: PqiC family protein [Alteromonas sp.]
MIRQLLRRKMHIGVLTVFLSTLVGCSAQPVVINHYMLNVASINASISPSQNAPLLSIERVHLPDHLEQRSLVMQQQNGTLSIATKHVWAQPLNVDIGGLLSAEITRLKNYNAFYGPAMSRHTENIAAISIYVEHFMPVASGEVILSGYWLERHRETLRSPQRFSYSASLNADGYAASVAQMRRLITQLAADINATIQKE